MYSAWPIFLHLDADERATVASVATLEEVAPPPGAPEQLPPATDRSPAERLWAALAFTEMRTRMNRDIDARVLVGGRLSGQAGLLPGVVEEAALSVEAALPLFVIGGFGGAASLVGAAMRGEATPELSLDYQPEQHRRLHRPLGGGRAPSRPAGYRRITRRTGSVRVTRPPETGPLLMRVLWPMKVGGGGHHGETTQAHA